MSGMFTVTTDFQAFDDLMVRITGTKVDRLNSLVKDSAEILTETLKTEAPVGHDAETGAAGGRLRDSLMFQIGYLGATLEGVGYAQFVITGTRPHVIRPRASRALAFYWARMGGRAVFAKVNHPGTRPNDFRRKGFDLAYDMGLLDEAFSRFWSSLGGEGGA